MTFLVVFVSTVVELALGSAASLRDTDWVGGWRDWLTGLLGHQPWWNGLGGLLVTVGVPMLVIGFAGNWLSGWAWPAGFLFGVAVVLYCLGPGDLNRDIDRYFAAANDQERASAADALAVSLDSPREDDAAFALRAMLVAAHDRIFAALFWFVVLGPMGIVLFRQASVMRHDAAEATESMSDWAEQLYQILVWIPARLFALGFGIAGSFTHAFEAWREAEDFGLASGERVIGAVGLGAVQSSQPEASDAEPSQRARAVRGLINRTLIVWLTLLALLALAGITP
jgi:AmpE protein